MDASTLDVVLHQYPAHTTSGRPPKDWARV